MRRAWLTLLFALLAAACSTETPPPASRTPAPAAATSTRPVVIDVFTDTPASSATVTQAATQAPTNSIPEVTATAADAQTPTPTEGPCTDDSDFLTDLTVPDGTQFQPGQFIGKQWSVRNNGTCDWNAGYRLVLVSGNAMGARSEQMLFPARAGVEAVIEVGMVAPAEPGSYTSRWQARNSTGDLFGDRIFITIEVVAPPPPPSDTPTP